MVKDVVKTTVVTATDFKAKCLAMLDEMELRGETITITRWGKPVAMLCPPEKDAWKSPKDSWKGTAEITGDIVNSDSADTWDVVSGA
jgi:antitoxin (DNA-binding transcriptional repressor) of toxin-antitoxin stability system